MGLQSGASQFGSHVGSGSDEPLLSSLPTDDADFREIVEEFVQRLSEKIEAMEQAWQDRDFDELAALAHWLKGSGGTAGFDAFTTPAKALEQMAKQHNAELTLATIDDLRSLAERIVIPTAV
jgi:HPt (histidine-containing phosphotransfer) domain-containing protein